MASIFVSHSQRDKQLVDFFSTIFAGTKVKAYFEEFEKFESGQVTSSKVIEDIESASALFVLLSRNVEQIPHTRDWVIWESGAARTKPIWVFEPLEDAQSIRIAIPHLAHYVLFEKSDAWRAYLRQVVNSFDNSSLLPIVLGTAGVGAVIAKEEAATGAILGGVAGVLLHAATRSQPIGISINCPKCALAYSVHLPYSFQTLRCPSCNQYLSLPETAGVLQLKATQGAQSASLF